MTSTFVDGDMFAADAGALVRFVGGKNEGWTAKAPKDSLLRSAPNYSLIAAGPARREGQIYGYDKAEQADRGGEQDRWQVRRPVPPRRRRP